MTLAGTKVAMVASVEASFIFLFSNQLKQLTRHGIQLTALSSLEHPENLDFFKKLGIEFIPISIQRQISPLADLKTLIQLLRIFHKRKFDLIHTQTPKPNLLGAIAGKLAGIPVINTARPIFREMPEGARRKFFIWMEKIACSFADLILLENPLDLELYLKLRIAPEKKLKIQGNGIDLSRFDPEKISPLEIKKLRQDLKIPENAFVIGCVARYVYEKGYQELFQAFKELLPVYPHLYLLTVGLSLPSERDPIPSNLPQQLGIANKVIRLENRTDMEKIYALMNLVVLPTYRDCFPRSLIEASAMAKPIIASDLIGCRVVVKPGETGILVPPRQSQPLKEAIEKLVKNPELCITLGKQARRYALENLNEEIVCQRILENYTKIITNSRLSKKKKIPI